MQRRGLRWLELSAITFRTFNHRNFPAGWNLRRGTCRIAYSRKNIAGNPSLRCIFVFFFGRLLVLRYSHCLSAWIGYLLVRRAGTGCLASTWRLKFPPLQDATFKQCDPSKNPPHLRDWSCLVCLVKVGRTPTHLFRFCIGIVWMAMEVSMC